MTKDNMGELLPCPFCDGPVHKRKMGDIEGCFHIGQPHCPVEPNRMMTIKQWNTRSPPIELVEDELVTPAMIEAGLRSCMDAEDGAGELRLADWQIVRIYKAMRSAAIASLGVGAWTRA